MGVNRVIGHVDNFIVCRRIDSIANGLPHDGPFDLVEFGEGEILIELLEEDTVLLPGRLWGLLFWVILPDHLRVFLLVFCTLNGHRAAIYAHLDLSYTQLHCYFYFLDTSSYISFTLRQIK